MTKPEFKIKVTGGNITMSCSRRVQLKQFEPVESFCSATSTFEVDIDAGDQKAITAFFNSKAFNNIAYQMAEFIEHHTDETLSSLLESA